MSTASAVAHFDARPFFEKALAYGVQHGILTPEKLHAICQEAPKGMVQIARYFGNENLRPDLEQARARLVNLVSLHLEHSTEGDLRQAAEQLREHSLLSRSKAGSDMLKALIVMPQHTHFGMHESRSFQNEHIPQLAKWSLRPLADYRAELAKRQSTADLVEAALWFAQTLELDHDSLEESGKDAEAFIRTGLLVRACKRSEMPSWQVFEKIITALCSKLDDDNGNRLIPLPADVPPALRSAVDTMRHSVIADLLKVRDSQAKLRKLFDQTPAFMGRYFWRESGLQLVNDFDRAASAAWTKATQGHTDDGSLLTLFLRIAAGSTAGTLLTEKSAATLVRKIRKSGFDAQRTRDYIAANAPAQYQEDYLAMWNSFVDESEATLLSDHDYQLHDALALLRRECHVQVK